MALSDPEKFANLVNSINEVLLRQSRLEERLAKLEHSLFGGSTQPAQEPLVAERAVEPVEAIKQPLEMFAEEATTQEIPVPAISTRETPVLETKVGLTVLNRVGVVTLVLGVAFFFKWAVDNNWVGPSGRVALGLLAGFTAIAIGDLLWRKGQQIYAQGITGAGIAIIYLALYAAFDFYHLVPQAVAFLLMLATTAMAAALALRYNAIAIAALGFFGAYLIPLLLSTGEDRAWFLLTYLLLLNFAATELASRRNWQPLELLSFAATLLIFGAWLFQHGRKSEDHLAATVGVLALCAQRFRTSWPILFLFGQLLTAFSGEIIWHGSSNFIWFSLLLAASGLAFCHIRRYPAIVPTAFIAFWITACFWSWEINKASYFLPLGSAGFLLFYAWTWWRFAAFEEAPTARSMSVFALNGIAYYGLAYSILQHDYHHWLGLLAVAVAASYLAFGSFLHRKTGIRDGEMVMLALGFSVAFLTIAIPVQLSGFSVTIAWSIQAAALTWIGVRLNSLRAVFGALIVFALAFLRVAAVDSLMYPNSNSYTLILNSRFFTFATLAVALLLAGYWCSKLDQRLAILHFVAGHLVMLSGLSLEVIGWADRSTPPADLLSVETVGITILFAIYAVVLVSFGVATRTPLSRLAGLVLTAVVILKLYLFDVWQLGRVYQIIAFVILGLLLLSTSFLYSRFKGLIDHWRSHEKTSL